MRIWLGAFAMALVAYAAISGSPAQVPNGTILKGGIMNPAPTPKDYADLGNLPDWSGVWDPITSEQNAQIRTNPTPWNERAQVEGEHKGGALKKVTIDATDMSLQSNVRDESPGAE